jgi:hypothetical protein
MQIMYRNGIPQLVAQPTTKQMVSRYTGAASPSSSALLPAVRQQQPSYPQASAAVLAARAQVANPQRPVAVRPQIPTFVGQPPRNMVPPMACPPPPCGVAPPPHMSEYSPDQSRPITAHSPQSQPIGGGCRTDDGCSIFGNRVRDTYGDVEPVSIVGSYRPAPPPPVSTCQPQATNGYGGFRGFGSPDGLGNAGLFGCRSC